MATYSFLATVFSLIGPGGVVDLSAGAGIAEEGISFEPRSEINDMTIGAGGEVMHSLGADKSRVCKVVLLKTSAVNQQLQTMYNLQTATPSLHGNNIISGGNSLTKDSITCQNVAFKKGVPNGYATKGGTMEWLFDVGVFDQHLGGNV